MQHISIPSHHYIVNNWSEFGVILVWIFNWHELGSTFSIWDITPVYEPMSINVDRKVKCIWWQIKCQPRWSLQKSQNQALVFDGIYQWDCCQHPLVLWLQTVYMGSHVHTVIMGVHFNHHDIGLSKHVDLGCAGPQTERLIQHNLMKYEMAPKFKSVCFIWTDLVVEYLNGRDYDYSPWCAIICHSMGCSLLGRSTVMEMLS